MSQWTGNKVPSDQINGGQEYVPRIDNVGAEAVNAAVNNSLYAQDFVDTIGLKTTDINGTGTASAELIENPTNGKKNIIELKNLKGAQGVGFYHANTYLKPSDINVLRIFIIPHNLALRMGDIIVDKNGSVFTIADNVPADAPPQFPVPISYFTSIKGNGIKSSVVEYAISDSTTTIPTNWQSTIPSLNLDEEMYREVYIWSRTTLTFDDESTQVSYSIGKQGDAALVFLAFTEGDMPARNADIYEDISLFNRVPKVGEYFIQYGRGYGDGKGWWAYCYVTNVNIANYDITYRVSSEDYLTGETGDTALVYKKILTTKYLGYEQTTFSVKNSDFNRQPNRSETFIAIIYTELNQFYFGIGAISSLGSTTSTVIVYNSNVKQINISSLGITASVDDTSGTPNVIVTKGGTVNEPTFDLEFSGLKGKTGEQGNGYYRANVALATTATSVARNSVNPVGKAFLASDTIVDTQGNVFAVTENTAASSSTVSISYRYSIKGTNGTNGLEGLGIWRSSASTATGTTSIKLSTITVPTGRSVKVGDLIIANNTNSYMYRVTEVSSTAATVSYITSLRGATGATGLAEYDPVVVATGASSSAIPNALVVTLPSSDITLTTDMHLSIILTDDVIITSDFLIMIRDKEYEMFSSISLTMPHTKEIRFCGISGNVLDVIFDGTGFIYVDKTPAIVSLYSSTSVTTGNHTYSVPLPLITKEVIVHIMSSSIVQQTSISGISIISGEISSGYLKFGIDENNYILCVLEDNRIRIVSIVGTISKLELYAVI